MGESKGEPSLGPKVPVHNWVREARRHANLSQEDLAERAGMSRRALQLIEYGGYIPSVGVALRLARALDVQVEVLFSLVDPDVPDGK